jgi:small subunit ribosomal protein S17
MSTETVEHRRRTLEGEVVSDRMDKTVTVLVRKRVIHSLYKKYYTRRRRYMAHDPQNECRVGDLVRIEECRPLSKHKNWRVREILEKRAQ